MDDRARLDGHRVFLQVGEEHEDATTRIEHDVVAEEPARVPSGLRQAAAGKRLLPVVVVDPIDDGDDRSRHG